MKIDFSRYKKSEHKNKYLALNLTPDLIEKVEKYAKKEQVKKSQLVREFIKVGITEYEKN